MGKANPIKNLTKSLGALSVQKKKINKQRTELKKVAAKLVYEETKRKYEELPKNQKVAYKKMSNGERKEFLKMKKSERVKLLPLLELSKNHNEKTNIPKEVPIRPIRPAKKKQGNKAKSLANQLAQISFK